MPAKRHYLDFPCPECGRYDGHEKIQRWSRKPKSESTPNVVQSRENPLSEALERYGILFKVIGKIWPVIIAKHPELKEKEDFYRKGVEVVRKFFEPLHDGRSHASWYKWFQIMKYSMEHGYNAASTRFALRDTSGKILCRYATPKQIKRKEKAAEDFALDSINNLPGFAGFMLDLFRILDADAEIEEEFDKKLEEYKNGKDIKKYDFEYHKIVHYDAELREEQKTNNEKRISKKIPDGKREHGPFSKSDIALAKAFNAFCFKCKRPGVMVTQVGEDNETIKAKDNDNDCLYIIHYNKSEFKKRSYCRFERTELSKIVMLDPRYSLSYLPAIWISTDAVRRDWTEDERTGFYKSVIDLLRCLHFPRQFIVDKIKSDVKESYSRKLKVNDLNDENMITKLYASYHPKLLRIE